MDNAKVDATSGVKRRKGEQKEKKQDHRQEQEQERELIRQLEDCVDGMRNHISDEPYITTIPQDEPKFHHYSRHAADAWLANTPFDRNENYQVQYQTFFYREPYSDIYERVRYSHFDRPSRPPPPTSSVPPRSATGTPSVGPKKKISLAAYKNKQTQGATSTSKPLETEPERQHQLNAQKPRPSAHDVQAATTKPVHKPGPETQKNKNTAPNAQHNSSPPDPAQKEHRRKPSSSDFPKKRPSPSPPPVKTARPTVQKASHNGLASLPTGRLSPLESLYLPGRLSPTLPPRVVAALDGHDKSSASDTSADGDGPPKTVAPRPVSKHDSVFSHPNEKAADPPKPHSPQNPVLHQVNHIKSLVVVLRIPKKHRASFRRLVQFSPRATKDRKPDHATTNTNSDQIHDTKVEHEKHNPGNTAGLSTAPLVNAAHSSKSGDKVDGPASVSSSKRPHPPDDHEPQPHAKRKKAPATLKLDRDPGTPLQPPFRSPAIPHSAIKSQQQTPTGRKEIRGPSAMKRVESSDSLHAGTPTTHDRTPASKMASTGPQTAGSNLRPSPSSSSAKTPESQAWATEFARLSRVAKELKHAAPDLPTSAVTSSATDKKVAELAALSSIESLLAFILAFYCNDKSYACRNPPQLSDPQNWSSCYPFWRQVKSRCQPYPHLCGLTAYLGAVYNGVLMRRLTVPNAKPDPKKLHESVSAAMKAAEEASAKLPLSALRTEYPVTWMAGMSSSSSSSSSAEPVPGQYEGRFSLDIGIHTDPQEAVRFAQSLMTEWCTKKGLDYKLRLKLSA